MPLMRSTLSESDRRFIIGRSGGCCNKCRVQVFIENEFSERARIGDDAHIWAYSEDGPRGNAHGAPENRNERKNIILLCKNCHSEIDQQTKKYPPDVLTEMRNKHYEWVELCLSGSIAQKPRFHYIAYLNVSRVDMYAVASSIPLPKVDFGSARCFSDLGFAAGRIMASYTHVLNSEEIYSHKISKDDNISILDSGQYIFIEPMNFRTSSIGSRENLEAAWDSERSIIYRIFGDWKLICQIDPMWITTSTAGSTLRSGQAKLCGVMRVARVDAEACKVYTSPLFLAQPGGTLDAYQS